MITESPNVIVSTAPHPVEEEPHPEVVEVVQPIQPVQEVHEPVHEAQELIETPPEETSYEDGNVNAVVERKLWANE